jgi:hypothetical protein
VDVRGGGRGEEVSSHLAVVGCVMEGIGGRRLVV